MRARNPWRLPTFLWTVAGLAVPAIVLAVARSWDAFADELTGPVAPVIIILMLALVIGELFPIPIARGEEAGDEITVSSLFAVVLLLIAPVPAALIAQAIALTLDEGVRRHHWGRLPFNIGQYALTIIAAKLVYDELSGRSFTAGIDGPGGLPLGSALIAVTVFLLLNNGFVCIAVALQLQARISRIWNQDLNFHAAVGVPLVGLAPAMAQAVAWTPWSLLVLITPIVALHRSGHHAMAREQEALRDPLTKLANRTLLQTAATRTLASATLATSMVLIDLDHFKEVNDTLGHAVGDELLNEVARRLTAGVRAGDLVARLGGDEFVVLARGLTGSAEAEQLAERLLAALRQPVQLGDLHVDVHASIGLSVAPDHGNTVVELLRVADIALYQAKRDRGSYVTYQPNADEHSVARLGLQGDLRRALADPDDTGLQLAYQPQVDLRTGRVDSVECLLRWQHPTLGLVPPDVFIPIAENTGLIEPLTRRVLDLALAQLRAWQAQGHDIKAAVNLSARQVTDVKLPDMLAAILARHGIAPDRLVLEVTETRLMSDPDRAAKVLSAIAAQGIELSIDDFGTGYSSLAYLQRLSVNELKIDRTFIGSLGTDAADDGPTDNATIVRSTIDLGHGLGLRVVAEGVEDATSAALLSAWGCDLLQGYHFGRPTPAIEVQSLGQHHPLLPGAHRRLPRPLTPTPAPPIILEVHA